MIAIALIAAMVKVFVGHVPLPSPTPSPIPVPEPQPSVQLSSIAPQKARLQLSDGRTAMFLFALSAGKLSCTAAVGLDQGLLAMTSCRWAIRRRRRCCPIRRPSLADSRSADAPRPATSACCFCTIHWPDRHAGRGNRRFSLRRKCGTISTSIVRWKADVRRGSAH